MHWKTTSQTKKNHAYGVLAGLYKLLCPSVLQYSSTILRLLLRTTTILYEAELPVNKTFNTTLSEHPIANLALLISYCETQYKIPMDSVCTAVCIIQFLLITSITRYLTLSFSDSSLSQTRKAPHAKNLEPPNQPLRKRHRGDMAAPEFRSN